MKQSIEQLISEANHLEKRIRLLNTRIKLSSNSNPAWNHEKREAKISLTNNINKQLDIFKNM